MRYRARDDANKIALVVFAFFWFALFILSLSPLSARARGRVQGVVKPGLLLGSLLNAPLLRGIVPRPVITFRARERNFVAAECSPRHEHLAVKQESCCMVLSRGRANIERIFRGFLPSVQIPGK